ncbi:MAG: MiaB/RimO family radical SAM methylthiotransferase, partial [Anaerolineales bacterium]
VIPNQAKDNLVKEVLPDFDLEPLARQPIPGARHRTRAFIKVQDGCDNHCTFCVTRLARGASRSRPIYDVLADIQAAIQNPVTTSPASAAREIVLSGVHLGSWGQDFSVPLHLKDLIQAILQDTDVERLRLSSLEPWDLNAEFFRLWENPRLCRHLHLPLQSGSAETLRRMGRNTTPLAYSELVANARQIIPGVAITTDIIVAFPGENDNEFAESLAFIRDMAFASGHVFTYSPRPGTPAARMKNQVNPIEGKRRNALVREVLHQSESHYRRSFIGSTLSVLWESIKSVGPDGWQLSGLTGNYLRVNAYASQPLWNQISLVKIEKEENGELSGTIRA